MHRNKIFSERFRQVRTLRGYDFNQLEKKACINAARLRRYELDSVLPSTPSLCRLAQVLNISVDYLLGLSNDLHAIHGFEKTVQLESGNTVTLSASHSLSRLPLKESHFVFNVAKQLEAEGCDV